MSAFAAAAARREPATRRLWFDVASIVDAIWRHRRAGRPLHSPVGPDRVLYGSDAAVGTNLRPRRRGPRFGAFP